MDTCMEMEGMNIAEERLLKWSELEGMDTMDNHTYEEVDMGTVYERLLKQTNVDDMDMVGKHMVEDIASDLKGLKECTGAW
jgi:hypothetical protein